jgi:hypothetical protein
MKQKYLVPLALALIVLWALLRACNGEDTPPPVAEPTPPAAEDTPAPEATPSVEAATPEEGTPEEETPPAVPSRVSILTAETLPTGPAATGRPGDVVLTSDRGVRFVISALDHKGAFQESGGNLIDLVVGDSEDVFDGMGTWLERTFPRQGRYTEQTLLPEDSAVRVTGVDSENPLVAVTTTWALLPEGDDERVLGRLAITTTITNASDEPLVEYDLGDIVGWGGLQHFAPGPGFELAGVLDESLPWVGGQAPDHAVILVGPGPLTGPHGSSWSDPVWSAPTIPVGTSHTYERLLLVGATLSDLLPAVLEHQGTASAQLTVIVRRGSEERVAGATVDFLAVNEEDDTKKPILRGITGDDGSVTTRLPPGRYKVVGSSSSRYSISYSEVRLVPDAEETIAVLVSAEARVLVRAVDEHGEDIPARFSFVGRGSTADPNFGPDSWAIGGNRANVTEAAVVPIPPGNYILSATRGPAWSLETREVTIPSLPPGAPETAISYEFNAVLRPVIPTDGWLQCDLHQHAAYSADSSVPPVDGLIASVAEGLDCIATTDHDAVADWTAHVADSGLADSLLWLPGIEVTSETDGHFNAYPWDPSLGTIEHKGLSPSEIAAAIRSLSPDAIIQLNHPSWGRIGMWDIVGIDPSTGLLRLTDDEGGPTGATYHFDAVEILNGSDVEHAAEVLSEWLRMVDAGKGEAAIVGNSDSHRLVGQERGSARTWIHLDGQARSVQAVVTAIRDRRDTTASTGPLLYVRVEGQVQTDDTPIVVTMQAPTWLPVDEIEIVAGDPLGNGSWTLGTWHPGMPGLTERIEGELRTWELRYTVPMDGVDGWIVAIARGEAPMKPWSDATAFAITSPLRLVAPPPVQ